ncbi:hypothetical protein F7734_02335 [Scytonema sp. UIC 10036]|uniref:hypothetical protein n=1 Tax=Scytonema sp. UIC 10036 TaxID=2304196 RepID=UPI0012DAEB4A|nr:hypothetical protein [Scytonema sp. UIC 10036]MUG91388.1 hypothetical protein [Scytonema sp. UIC 10036]
MHYKQAIQTYYPFRNTTYQSNQNYQTIKLQPTQYNEVKVFDTFIEQGGTTLALIVFLSGLLAFLNIKISKGTSENLFNDSEINYTYPYDLPCSKCYFFSKNHYLPCAVNPTIVMSEEAKNCSDYLFYKK